MNEQMITQDQKMPLKILSSSQLRGKLYLFLITVLAIYGGYMLCIRSFAFSPKSTASIIYENIKQYRNNRPNIVNVELTANETIEVANTEIKAPSQKPKIEIKKDEKPLEHSQYYASKYKENIPLYWTRDVLKLSTEVWNWWFNLLHKKPEDPYAFIEGLYKAGSTDKDPRESLLQGNKVYKSCAVVGNSDVILNTNQGEIIDKCDAVFRFNNGITKGFEKDVGTKTTHRILYPESSRANFDYSGYKVVLIPFKVGDIHWLLSATTDGSFALKTWAKVQRKINSSPENASVIHPEFVKYVQQAWVQDKGSKYPSTGIVGVLFALHLCEDLSVHAFGANKQGIWKHYYEKADIKAGNTQHDANKEQDVIRTLHKYHELKYYSPEVEPWWQS